MASAQSSGIERCFGPAHAIRGVDIAVAGGEFCVLVGLSGCGMSTLPLPLPVGSRTADGQGVLYGMSPEHCAVGDDGLPVEVAMVEPTGADMQPDCRFHGHEIVATVGDGTDRGPGDRVAFAPDSARAHLFDAASGLRLAI